jgi:transposase
MPRPALTLSLSKKEQSELDQLLAKGVLPVRVVWHALALRWLHGGDTAGAIAEKIPLTAQAIRNLIRRYREGGLERALYDKQRPGAKTLLDPAQRQRIVALVCSAPPAGHARWSIRLIAEESVKRKLVPGVGRETIRLLLQHHDLKPWREKNVVRRPGRWGLQSRDGGRARNL